MRTEAPKLNHERLDVYQTAIEFFALADVVVSGFHKGNRALTDQMRRASLSIPLNIAEGYGKRTSADRSRFYDIARGSAHECGAILDAAAVLDLVAEAQFVRGKTLLVRVVQMLVKMSQ